MTLDIEPEDVAGVLTYRVDIGGKFDAAQLSSPAGQHLRLDHDRRAEPFSGRNGLVDCEGNFAG